MSYQYRSDYGSKFLVFFSVEWLDRRCWMSEVQGPRVSFCRCGYERYSIEPNLIFIHRISNAIVVRFVCLHAPRTLHGILENFWCGSKLPIPPYIPHQSTSTNRKRLGDSDAVYSLDDEPTNHGEPILKNQRNANANGAPQ